jgi:thioredoxin 1
MTTSNLMDYVPVPLQSTRLQSGETHFYSFRVTATAKRLMGYQLQPNQQYLCHFTDQRLIFEPQAVMVAVESEPDTTINTPSFHVPHGAIKGCKLVRALNLATYAQIQFQAPPAELSVPEWVVAVSAPHRQNTQKQYDRAGDFVQLGRELLGLHPTGQVFAMPVDPQVLAQFQQEVAASQELVLVDFWAPGCEPCQALQPIVDEVVTQYKDQLKCIEINIAEKPAIPMHYGIDCFPALLVFKAGTVIDKIIGTVPKQILVKVLNRHIASD